MICFVVALKKEVQGLLNKATELKEFKIADKPAYSCKLSGKPCIIAISGIGKVSSALTAQLLIDKYNPEFIINFGTCGGMNNSVEILKYYAIEKCCQYDFDLSTLDNVPVGYIQEYNTVFFNAYTKTLNFLPKTNIASADKFTSKESDVKIINDMGCSACDMEAGAIAQVCTSNKVPFIAIKGISDVHGSGVQEDQFYKNLSTVGDGFPDIILQVLASL